jgi:hypothetical protein
VTESTDRSGNGPAPEGDAPRLQDTVERESIRLPLPDNPPESPSGWEPAEPPPPPPPPPDAAAEPAAGPEPPPASGSTTAGDDADPGPLPELLVGAAFAGGLVLALLLRRLRS